MLNNMENLNVPGPVMNSVTEPFWEAAEKGEFILQNCDACARSVFYPRSHCPHCWSKNLNWKKASGRGRIKTWSIVHKPGHPAWGEASPYVLAIVELDEGPSMMTHLLTDPDEELSSGLPVKVKFTKVNGVQLPFFELVNND